MNVDVKSRRKILAVIDTNVLVSALISRNPASVTVRVLNALMKGKFIPLYHEKIIDEYTEVLHRPKFHISDEEILSLLDEIHTNGMNITPTPTGAFFADPTDIIFYEVAMTKQDDHAWLVTGNMRHYPVEKFIITPREFMEVLDGREHSVNDSNELIAKDDSHDS